MANNIESILGELLKSDALKGISSASGSSESTVKSVLKDALPSLLGGASNQAKNEETKTGFLQALTDHAGKDTSNLTSFFNNVDITDGGKIVSHLLGTGKDETADKVAKDTGIDVGKVIKILAVAAPLLMSVMGKKAKEEKKDDNPLGSLAGALLGNFDASSLIKNFLK